MAIVLLKVISPALLNGKVDNIFGTDYLEEKSVG
jgi:hypothetical protein